MQELDATSQRESVLYIIEVLKEPLVDPRESMPKPALKTDVPRMTDLTIGKIVEGVVTNITPFGIFIDLGMKQTGFVHKSEVSNNASHTPASVANVGDVLRARVTSLDFQRDRIVLSLRNVPAEGESVPDSAEQHEQSVATDSTNNTNVMPSTASQTTPVDAQHNEEPAAESHHEDLPHDESVDMNEEQAEYEQSAEHEHEEHVYEEMQGEGEEHPHDNEEYAQEMHEEAQYGEEFEDTAAQEHTMDEVQGEEYMHGEEQYGEEYDNTEHVDEANDEHE